MSDTTERTRRVPDEGPDEQLSEEERRTQRWERRRGVARSARRVLARSGLQSTIRGRLALLDAAGEVYDLDESVDVYGNGVVEALEQKVAGLLGMEAAAFFPTGTMAQQVALRCWAGRTGDPAVALHALAHPEVHERDAFSQVSGLRPVLLTGEPRQPTAQEVRGCAERFGALMLELPLRDAGYLLPTWDELNELVEAARERDAVVHFDGARLWESTVHFGRPLDEIAGLADSVYVSFYKSLDGFGGAALAGPAALVEEAKTWRHRYGGQVFQQFPTALSALLGLERELPRLPEYVRHARVVAAALPEALAEAGLPWSRVHPEVPHTNEFQVWLPYDADVVAEAAIRTAEETGTLLFGRAWNGPVPGLAQTEVDVRAPGLEWSVEDVRTAVADFVVRLREEAGRAHG
ncbi:beta-eliminating lyase-related protein [Streptomyces longwoodensis]|uniref:threonine aldolase family protein n=1 Tax=Streptomyces longwoodensis TaxID=68231 RepID=UPI002DD8E482|nr:beta-eliminating lyase-related protein [Streptomyces longwoodensis]WRY89909.1 beta-eliminating lyase-related protein [Streptomyces longwoodensis]WTI45778.1 beta-eliminating lyase-related protein [Streptomyces longwoodensis]